MVFFIHLFVGSNFKLHDTLTDIIRCYIMMKNYAKALEVIADLEKEQSTDKFSMVSEVFNQKVLCCLLLHDFTKASESLGKSQCVSVCVIMVFIETLPKSSRFLYPDVTKLIMAVKTKNDKLFSSASETVSFNCIYVY